MSRFEPFGVDVTRPRFLALLAVLLVVPAMAIYGAYLDNPRVFDDRYFRFADMLAIELPAFAPRFLTYWSFRLNGMLFGDSLEAVRAVNAAIHAANALALFLLGRILLGTFARFPPQPAVWVAFGGALVFSLHPVAAFAVAYLIQRSILLSTLFALLAVICHLQAHLRDDGRWMAAAASLFLLSVFAKEHSVALPAVFAALSFALVGRGFAWRRTWLWGFVAYGLISIAVTLVVRHGVAGIYEPQAQMFMNLPENARLVSAAAQSIFFFKYLGLWLAPIPGSLAIDMQHDLPRYVLPWWGLAGLFGCVATASFAVWKLRAGGGMAIVALALAWALGLFVTEFWGIRLSETFVLYRSYLWCVLLPLVAVLAVSYLARIGVYGKSSAVVVVVALSVTLGFLLQQRLELFSDEVAIWEEAAQRNEGVTWPGAARAHSNLGGYLGYEERYEEAFGHFIAAVRINPNHVNAWCNLATLYQLARKPEQERAARAEARRLDPAHPCAR